MCVILCIVLRTISSVAAPHQIQSGCRSFTGGRRCVKPWTSNCSSLRVYWIYLNMRQKCFHNPLSVKKGRGGGGIALLIVHKSFPGNWTPYMKRKGCLTCKVILHLDQCGNLPLYAEQFQFHCHLPTSFKILPTFFLTPKELTTFTMFLWAETIGICF
jgi:hypothetical protein